MTDMTIGEDERTQRRRRLTGVMLVYQHVAAAIAVFALIAFLSHFIYFEWHGFIATLGGAMERVLPTGDDLANARPGHN